MRTFSIFPRLGGVESSALPCLPPLIFQFALLKIENPATVEGSRTDELGRYFL